MEGNDRPPTRRVRIPFLLAAALLLLCAGTAQILGGEIIPVGSGLGWDGRFYADVASDLPAALSAGEIDGYRFRRILPSAIVWLVLRAVGLPRDVAHARDVFAWLNLALALVTLTAWAAAARRCGIGEGGRWLGFVLLFFNFANLRMPFYYAPLTDSAAQALGAALLYFHVAGRPLGMLAMLALGAFTWPSFLPFGALLFVYPASPSAEAHPAPSWWRPVVASSVVIVFLALVAVHRADVVGQGGSLAAAVVVVVYLWRVVTDLAGADSAAPSALFRRPALVRWGVVLLLAGGASVATLAFAAPARFDTGYFLRHLAIYSLARPGIFLVAHWAYFGLVVAALVAFWPQAVDAARRLGTGLTLFVLAHLVWGIHSESRQLIDGLPALALVTTLALTTVRWPRLTVPAAALIALAASKVWLPINREGFLGRSPETYPAQYYFLNHGPWMASAPYRIQALALVAVCALLWVIRRRLTPADVAPEAVPPFEIPRALARAGAVLAMIVATLAIAEAGARLRVQPDRAGEGVPAHDRPAPLPQPASPAAIGRPRVLLLGDEFVQAESSAPSEGGLRASLERALAAGGAPREVVTLAQPHSGTAQAELLFRCAGRASDPEMVVLFFRSSDLEENGNAPDDAGCPDGALPSPAAVLAAERPRGRFDAEPLKGSVALRLLGHWMAAHAAPAHAWMIRWGLAERPAPPSWLWPYGPIRDVRPWWDRSESQLRRLAEEVAPRRLVVFYVPEDFEVDASAWDLLTRRYDVGRQFWWPSKVADHLADMCRRLGVTLVDPRRALSGGGTGPSAYSPEGTWTEAGRATAARELARALTGGAKDNR